MKRALLPVLLAVIVLFSAGGLVTWLFVKRERQLQKIEIPVSYLETTDTSMYSVQPILLSRRFPDDSLLVFLPKKENSQVYVYDNTNYRRLLFGDHHGVPTFMADLEGLSALFGRPVLNLSGFPQGKYYVHVTACDFGGFLQLDIADSLQ